VAPGFTGVDSLPYIGIIGQAEIQWAISETSFLSGGFMRRVQPSPLYQHVTNNRPYLAFQQRVGKQLVFYVNGGYSILQFGRDTTSATSPIFLGQGDRLDGHLDVNAQLAYHVFEWLSFGVTNNFDWRLTNAAFGTTNLSFLRNETLLLASIHY